MGSILLGITRETAPPVFNRLGRFERMRVILLDPDSALAAADDGVEDDDESPEILPSLNLLGRARYEPPPRLVLGEILRGEHGELYERIGHHIRRLRHLVAGPCGEVLDSAGIVERPNTRWGERPGRLDDRATTEPELELEATEPDRGPTEGNGRTTPDQEPAPAPPATRRLFAEPGQWRVLPLGAFRPAISPQLQHPERLQERHRLPCYVQVIEALSPQRIEALVEAALGDPAHAGRLVSLTPPAIAALQLGPLLPPGSPVAAAPPRPGWVMPGQRWAIVTVATDPTASRQAPATVLPQNGTSASPPANAQANVLQPGVPPTIPPWANVALAPSSVPVAVPAMKTEIPLRYSQPWEFRRNREEALYDLCQERTILGRLRTGWNRCFHRAQWRRWQALLIGRSAEEQLWAVRPPQNWLNESSLREWVRQTLQDAGYDSAKMAVEWEIFWRRKSD